MPGPSLPPEILEQIISCALMHVPSSLPSLSPPISTSILLTSRTFREIGAQCLYTNLCFTSVSRLRAFLAYFQENPESLRHEWCPRTIEFSLANVDVSTRIFELLRDLFLLYRDQGTEVLNSQARNTRSKDGDAGYDQQGRLALDVLRLGFNSHMKDEALDMVYQALRLVNPYRFIWTGPDTLEHHFSIAIVPPAVPYLFQAFSTYTNLRELTITHVAFVIELIVIPPIPTLEKVNFGQATFVEPIWMAKSILDTCALPDSKLREVRLVDVYTHSIWGSRLRRSDLEEAAAQSLRSLHTPSDSIDAAERLDTRIRDAKDTIRRVVVCQAKTERKYGGDRALDLADELL
ncbi:hypothetical protein DFP72DRAFT_816878 [Ephemerocybe angulata]|uniref:F-box domain-containing protein n=1 Tax=Ephemerocybe angulata TaxID=980116 RepID=A0A8H6M4G4_9AGAR|nr:hypothetical protein DFP72DRAFT_816878 [Tulosesus angulatus]